MNSKLPSRSNRHVSQACQNCRAARAKCNGALPCDRCSERGQDCAFASSGDGRSSRLDFRYKVAELQHENSVLRHFVAYLQQSSDHDNQQILGQLRRLSPSCLRHNVDALFNLTREVSSLPNRPHLAANPCKTPASAEQTPRTTPDPGPKQEAAAADEPGSISAFRELDHEGATRLAQADQDLLLPVLRILRDIPKLDRNLVLEFLSYALSSEDFKDSILPLLADRSSIAGLSPVEQQHLLGSPRTRDLPASSAVVANGYPPEVQARQLLNFTLPDFAIPPLTLPVSGDKSLLGAFFLSFLDAVSSALARGTPVDRITGPRSVDAEYLLRNRESHECALTIAVWAGNIVRSVLTTDIVPPLAGLICITRLLRWMLSPTLQHYAEIPEMARPLPVQRFVPHHPELDLCPHPAVRTALVYKYRDWLTATDMSDIQIQWSGSDKIFETDLTTGHRRPTELFESHVTVPDNWSFGKHMLDKYPEIVRYGAKVRPQ